MDDVERRSRLSEGRFAVHVDVEIEHEDARLRGFLGAVIHLAERAGAGFDVGLRAAGQVQRGGQLTFGECRFLRVLVGEEREISGLDQLTPEAVFKAERGAVDGVDVAQTDAREIGGLIELDEGGKHAVDRKVIAFAVS